MMRNHNALAIADIARKVPLLRSVSILTLALTTFASPAAFAQTESGTTKVDTVSTAQSEDVAVPQDGTPAAGDIVVTGIRARIESAQAIKRNADTFVDAITAEDIGALPDKSVNEVLQRVPGVNINRFQASSDPDHFSIEGSNVIIRGLSYVRSEFNGRDAFSVNTGRALGFNDVSPELLSSVQVFKNSTADRIEGGIAGVVDLRTRKPFDKNGLVMAATVEGSYGDLREKPGLGFSALVSNVWNSDRMGRFGLLLSYGRSDLYSQAFGSHITDYVYRADLSTADQRRYVPRGGSVRTQDFDRNRSTIDGSLQWESLGGEVKITAEYIRAAARSAWTERVIEVDLGSGGNPTPTSANPYTYDRNGLFTTGLLVDNAPNLQVFPKRQRDQETLTSDMSLTMEFRPVDRLKIVLDAQYTKATADDLDVTVYGAVTPLYTRFGETQHGVPDVEYVDQNGQRPAAFDNASSFYYRAAMDHAEQSEGDQWAFKADMSYDVDTDFLKAIRWGGRYSDREQTRRYAAYNWGNISESWNGGITPFRTTGDLAVEGYDFPNFQRGYNANPASAFYPSIDLIDAYRDGRLQAALKSVSTPQATWRPLAERPDAIAGTYYLPGETNVSDEQTQAAYVRADFGIDDLFGAGTVLSGNVGLRYTQTRFGTQGFVVTPNLAQNFGDAAGNDPRFPGQNIPVTTANALAIARFRCSAIQPGQSAPGYCLISDTRLQQLINFSDGSFQNIVRSNSYDDFLPSLNVNLKVGQVMFRGAVSRAMTRPDFGATAFAATLFYTDLVQIRNNGGNPETAPLLTTFTGGSQLTGVRAWNFDLGVEWYFQQSASLTLNAFYKDLKDILASGSNIQSFTNASGIALDTQVNQQVNIGTGSIRGFEVGYQQFYRSLPGVLGGLGVEANYTFVDPSTFPNAVSEPRYVGLVLPLQQLSRHTVNASLIYEKGGLSMRAAYNWRSGFLLTPRDEINPFSPIFHAPNGNLDGSIFYSISDHWKIGVYGANLLDTTTITRQQTVYDTTPNAEGGSVAGPLAPRSYFRADRRLTVNLRAIF